jgi:hypothetical protein
MTMSHGRYKVKVNITGKGIDDTFTMDYYPTENMTLEQVTERFACWDADGSKIISIKRVA